MSPEGTMKNWLLLYTIVKCTGSNSESVIDDSLEDPTLKGVKFISIVNSEQSN